MINFEDFSIIEQRRDILKELNNVISLKTTFDYERYINNFETDFSRYMDSKFALAVDSGTTALQLSLLATGVKTGDEVIIPSYTYISTALAVSNMGAKPIFVDIRKNDLTVNPEKIKFAVTDKTKAIIPVHIHGNPCQMDEILDICDDRNISLIEDCSQAHGAKFNGEWVGTFGIGCFSLHSSKNLGGVGDGGIIISNDESIINNIKKYIVPDNNGTHILNSQRTPCSINPMNAAILKLQLKNLKYYNERKNDIAKIYSDGGVNIVTPSKNCYGVYRDIVTMSEDREKLQQYLSKNGIETKIKYKIPLHLTKTYSYLGCKKSDFPVTEEITKETLCLPAHHKLQNDEVREVTDKINSY